MPLPFILIAAGAAAAGFGIKKGIDAKEKFDKAEYHNKAAQKEIKEATQTVERQRKDTTRSLEKLGNGKIKIMAGEMNHFVGLFQQIKDIECSDSVGIDELKNFRPGSPALKELSEVTLKASEMMGAAGGSVAAGSALAAGTFGAVGAIGTASTGTAIAGLSGAAATNATLAWLGGGSLAAGGMGMAGGMAVLGGLVAGPALAIGGMFMDSKAEEAYNDALSNREKARKYAEEGKNIVSFLQAVEERAAQIDDLLYDLNRLFRDFNKDMERAIKNHGVNYPSYDAEEKTSVMHAALTAKTIKMIVDTPLLKEDGSMDPAAETALSTGRKEYARLEA